MPDGNIWAIAIEYGLAPHPLKGFHHARLDLNPARNFVIYSGNDRYPITKPIEAISLREMAAELKQAPGN